MVSQVDLITEDYRFKYYLMRIFGKQWKKRVEEVTERYPDSRQSALRGALVIGHDSIIASMPR